MPSKIALATSLTSARVGVGLRCIESSICVAVITGLPFMTVVADDLLLDDRHLLQRQLHAEIAARHHDAVGLRDDLVEVRARRTALSILAMIGMRAPPCSCSTRRISRTSALLRTNDAAT